MRFLGYDRIARCRTVSARSGDRGRTKPSFNERARLCTVMAVAAQWSVDPTTLDERGDLPSHGLLGFLGQQEEAEGNHG